MRHDHDLSALGFPVRFAPWVGSKDFPSPHDDEEAVITDQVWMDYGTIERHKTNWELSISVLLKGHNHCVIALRPNKFKS